MPLAFAYFDTSVLVKRFVQETGSAAVGKLVKQYRVLSSVLAPVELLSALSRRAAAGEIAPADFRAIRVRLQQDRPFWELVEVSGLVLQRAEELVQHTQLKTLDAVHVASMLTFQASSGLNLPFVTGDARQGDTAETLNLTVIRVP